MKHDAPPPALTFLERALEEAKGRDLYRRRPSPIPSAARSFCSNDYLGLADRAITGGPSGASASRLVVGERDVHVALEAASAELVGQPAALAFTSGYAANVGLLSALAGPGDFIVSDALNHASIIDGARLSRAKVAVVPHLDVAAVRDALAGPRTGRAFVVTESYFSMDADTPDLAELRRVADVHGAALIVDEAHALGVLGPSGRGLCAERGVRADAIVGTYGKAFGAGGAFVAGCSALTDWLWNRARPFVFSTGLSPVLAQAALEGLRCAEAEPERRVRVRESAAQLRRGLDALTGPIGGHGHVIPWVLGGAGDAIRASSDLQARGIDVRAIRPPSVPVGTARLRFTVTAAHEPADIARCLDGVEAVLRGA